VPVFGSNRGVFDPQETALSHNGPWGYGIPHDPPRDTSHKDKGDKPENEGDDDRATTN